jgi:hypothetical protein
VSKDKCYIVSKRKGTSYRVKPGKANWICYISRRNCLPKHVTVEKINVMGIRGRRRKQKLDEEKEARGYWKLKVEALDRTLWRIRFGRGYGHVIRQATDRMTYLPMLRK